MADLLVPGSPASRAPGSLLCGTEIELSLGTALSHALGLSGASLAAGAAQVGFVSLSSAVS